MTNATLRGKPDAGNPHVRFDEGEVASVKPRRGSLLYKNMWGILVLAAFSAQAGTYTWHGGAQGNWSNVENWYCDGAQATTLPTTGDTVNLSATQATIVLTEDVAVGFLWAFQEGAEITFKTDVPGTRRSLAIKRSFYGPLGGWGGGFPGPVTAGTKLVLEGVKLFPNYESNPSQWGLNTQEVRFRNACMIEAKDSELYFGKLSSDAKLSLVLHDSTIWPREYGTIAALDVVLDNSKWSGFQKAVKVSGDASFTFQGTTPELSSVGSAPNPNVGGTLTFRYVLPAAPYASAPVVNGASVDFAPAGSFVLEIDETSPAFSSGTLQQYQLMAYTKSTANGLNLAGVTLPTLRTAQEVFSTGYMPGADTSGLPQYLTLTIDGSFDPSRAPLAAIFATPVPTAEGECFSGTVTELGSGASSATLVVRYGLVGGETQDLELGTVTASGAFSFVLSGLDSEAEYAYQLFLRNSKGESVASDAGTFSMTCGSVLSDTVTMTLNNGRGTIAGSLSVVGSGVTTVKLMVGRPGSELQEVAAQETSSAAFQFDYVFPDEGDWQVRIVCANTNGVKSWTDTTSVTARPVTVTDTCTYTWTGGDGRWDDPTCWSCSAIGAGLGRPTSRSEAVFGENVKATVTIPSDVTLAKLTPISKGGEVTFVGAGVSLVAANITAKGADATLMLDGVKLTDNASIWSLAWKLELGVNSVIKLRNRATLQVKEFNPQADGVVLDVAGGSTAFLRESWNGNTHSFRVVVEDATFEVPDKRMLISEIVFRGRSPLVKLCGLADLPIRLVYELPSEPYASAPFVQSTMVGGSIQNLTVGQATVIVSEASPARLEKRKGIYRLMSWGALKSGEATGVDPSVVTGFEGLKGKDFSTWGRAEGVAGSALPQYLDVVLKISGLTVVVQ